MKASTAAFCLIIFLVLVAFGAFLLTAFTNPPAEHFNLLLALIERALYIVSGGYLGIKIGEGESKNG